MTDHAAAHIAPATPPTHALGDVWQPSATHATFCCYTIQFVAAHGNDGTVKLLSDAANPPTIERTFARLAVTDDAAAATTATPLAYIVPAGHYVKLVAAGTGTPTITHQVETRLT